MGKYRARYFGIILVSCIILSFISFRIEIPVFAEGNTPQNPARPLPTSVFLPTYDWQIHLSSDDSLVCEFEIAHTGEPTDEELINGCNYQQFAALKNTQECELNSEVRPGSCPGIYLSNLNNESKYGIYNAPPSSPSALFSMEGCVYDPLGNFCTGTPSLVFVGEEQLPGETIVQINGRIGNSSFVCESNQCIVELHETDYSGIPVSFYATSSFGDKSDEYSGLVRVISVEGEENSYYVDVVGDQWFGKKSASCSDIWRVFPGSTTLPSWLSTPADPTDLQSAESLYYLAASLINAGVVDASICANGGLETPNTASVCGITIAGPEVQYWQNQFDNEIVLVANMDGIPASLLKNMFIRESQFWPGIYKKVDEVGFGHLTESGADTLLLWNQEFFSGFCTLILTDSTCALGYANLDGETQAILRGALLAQANASCSSCEKGIDWTKANFSIHIFAAALRANCMQVNQVVENNTWKSAREVSSYEDLWRFTLINYNAGAGCLGNAIYRTNSAGDPIDWEHVAKNLSVACQSSVDYVVDVTDGETERVTEFLLP
jgi:hypothetical protein